MEQIKLKNVGSFQRESPELSATDRVPVSRMLHVPKEHLAKNQCGTDPDGYENVGSC